MTTPMKKLLTILGVFLLSSYSYSQEVIPEVKTEELTEIIFKEGANRSESQAIAFNLYNVISDALKFWLQESHFIYGASCNSNGVGDFWDECRQNLNFNITFLTASVDLNLDGSNEVIVNVMHPAICGFYGTCTSYILEKDKGGWRLIGGFFPGGKAKISSNKNGGYFDIYYFGKSNIYSCIYDKDENGYDCDYTVSFR